MSDADPDYRFRFFENLDTKAIAFMRVPKRNLPLDID
jgi:hypothetical protein